MTVAVTGGTGVVGAAVVRKLVETGRDVRAMSRSRASEELLQQMGAIPVAGDLLDPDSLQRLVTNSEVVFNVAGVNEMCVRDTSHMEAVNVDGVSAVVAACRRAGVRRLVHTSSAVTIGESRGTMGRETSEHRGYFLSDYERTKFLGEQRLLESAGEDLEVVAVNPSSVQGPGRSTGTGKLILDVVNGRLRYLIDATISLVDIDDCARGHVLASELGEPGRRYLLSGATLGVRDAIGMAAEAAGRELEVKLLPGTLVSAMVSVAGAAAAVVGKDLPFCKEMVRVMRFGHSYDGSVATAELGLGYRPVEETIARTVAWFSSAGLLEG